MPFSRAIYLTCFELGIGNTKFVPLLSEQTDCRDSLLLFCKSPEFNYLYMGIRDISHPGLYTDLYQLTMSQGYFRTGMHKKPACFDYFFRQAPFGGQFVVFAGLADLLEVLEYYRFSKDECNWLLNKGFDREFCDYLSGYRFDGTVISVREGEIVFPGEPVLTVSGSMLSCQLIETLLLNILNFQSLIATKARRLKIACGDRKLIDFGLRRGQGTGAIAASRAAAIGGVSATSNVLAGYRHNIPVSGTMAHSWIQCFDSELNAFQKYADMYPDTSILLVDTYDSVGSGIPNAITVAKELEERGNRLLAIRLDSGNPLELSRKARTMLDDAGLDYVAIAVSDQLDEDRIVSLMRDKAPIDYFGVGTRLITGHPDGALSGVYKMSWFGDRPTMKYTDEPSKRSLPGIKSLSRVSDEDGTFRHDIISLKKTGSSDPEADSDGPDGRDSVNTQQLIRKLVMQNGKITKTTTDLSAIAGFSSERTDRVPEPVKRLSNPACYDIRINQSIANLIDKLKQKV